MTKVKNINGTSEHFVKCNCGNWTEHWYKFGGIPNPAFCRELTCMVEKPEGCHVQKADSMDESWYIVPLCSNHNKSNLVLEISEGTVLVPANRSQTCEKPD
jgi:hypothetical protein